MTRRWWCEWAWLGDGPDAEPGVLLEVDSDGRLGPVLPGTPPESAGDATRLSGLTIPGLVNAHSHAFHRALRARTHEAPSFWSWRDRMYRVAARLDPDSYLELAAAAFAEMALAGITTVGEFHYLHHGAGGRPWGEGDPMGLAMVEAASTAGIRLTLLDVCYLTGGIGVEPDAVQTRFSDGDAGRWAARAEGLLRAVDDSSTVKVGAAIHSARAVPPEAMTTVARWAEAHAAPLHAHVSEQPAENDACRVAYGASPARLLAERGATGERFTAIHATHVSDEDIELLGSSGSTVCLCPTTERDLADGIGPAARLRSAGSPLCLGTDSHAMIDLFEEARAVELDERLATGTRGLHSPASLLQAATVTGARALGWADAGRLARGALADFVTLDVDTPALAGTLGPEGTGAAAAAVFCGVPAAVTDVVVGGRPVVSGGRHLSCGDVGSALRKSISRVLAE